MHVLLVVVCIVDSVDLLLALHEYIVLCNRRLASPSPIDHPHYRLKL